MKKCIVILLAALLCCGCLLAPCFAESYVGEEDMTVILTADGKLTSNLTDQERSHDRALQPGDDITFTVTLRNESGASAEWYMKNQILHSLEDRSAVAFGGAYTYRLIYHDNAGNDTVLFDSDTVGGSGESPAGEGLHEAGNALKDYFYFASMKNGDVGSVTLFVALDGESQGNAYQDTLADLQMNFAVAVKSDNTYTVVKTGDETQLLPLYIVMAVSGLALLGILLHSLLKKRKQSEGRRGK